MLAHSIIYFYLLDQPTTLMVKFDPVTETLLTNRYT